MNIHISIWFPSKPAVHTPFRSTTVSRPLLINVSVSQPSLPFPTNNPRYPTNPLSPTAILFQQTHYRLQEDPFQAHPRAIVGAVQ